MPRLWTGYVNPGAFGFALAGVLCAIGSGYEAESGARRAASTSADGGVGDQRPGR
ncbi:hypothetical protein [Streptomyces sp. AK08-02]|uniref:hypothetical protein n=1 Tax=Streptomyces sp. AK08-02 TaxID=3028654 RepID=UPI0029BB701A|nr:hypothetical protein [Streptomyces sp. AK08-02]MDX3747570.1 hypothetical protein [Streptomyces sp. AK08-02]